MSDFGRHPDDRALALLAGGELRFVTRKLVARHVDRCDTCRATAAGFATLRSDLAERADRPEVDFSALAHKAKVAAEQSGDVSRSRRLGWRRIVAGAVPVAAVLLAALLLRTEDEAPAPQTAAIPVLDAESPPAVSWDPTRVQITTEGSLSVRAFDAASGTLTITEYYAP